MRMRMLKPGFFRNPGLAQLSPYHSLLFEGLWLVADREGRLRDHPGLLKADIFPLRDEVTSKDVNTMLNDLAKHPEGYIIRYTVDGEDFIQIRHFTKHQSPSVRESSSYIPALTDEAQIRQCLNTRRGRAGTLGPSKQDSDSDSDSVQAVSQHRVAGDETFAVFWREYPRRVAKQDARRAWGKVRLDELPALMAALAQQRASPQWLEDGGKFVPYPASWLNGRRWEDDESGPGPPEQRGYRITDQCERCEAVFFEDEGHECSGEAA